MKNSNDSKNSNNLKKQKPLVNTILTALFAALISAGSFINIPIGLVPIAIQDMLAMLSGLLLGPLYGTLSVFIFLVLGCIGLPVFSGKAGIQVILGGATGGFLLGYLVSAFLGGLLLKFMLPQNRIHGFAKSFGICIFVSFVQCVVLFVIGILGFMRILPEYGFEKTLQATLIPFIPGNIAKLIVNSLLTVKFRPILANYRGIFIQK